MAHLIRLSKRRLDEVFQYVDTAHQLSVLFDELIKAPTFASYLPGAWHTLDQRLTGEEIETEVGWLHKNMAPSQRTRIATLSASDLDQPYNSHEWLQHIKEARNRKGLDRVSRMRSVFSPINELRMI